MPETAVDLLQCARSYPRKSTQEVAKQMRIQFCGPFDSGTATRLLVLSLPFSFSFMTNWSQLIAGSRICWLRSCDHEDGTHTDRRLRTRSQDGESCGATLVWKRCYDCSSSSRCVRVFNCFRCFEDLYDIALCCILLY